MEIQKRNNDKEIFAPLKNKWLVMKQEEEVRQKYICLLSGNYHICSEYISNFPVPSVTSKQQKPIIDFVDTTAAKKANLQVDTKEMEQEIDKLVYKLIWIK